MQTTSDILLRKLYMEIRNCAKCNASAAGVEHTSVFNDVGLHLQKGGESVALARLNLVLEMIESDDESPQMKRFREDCKIMGLDKSLLDVRDSFVHVRR